MYVNLNLEEDELNVLEFCVDKVLTEWQNSYKEECEDKELQKNPIAAETLLYKKDWIEQMKNILDKICLLQDEVDNQYKSNKY